MTSVDERTKLSCCGDDVSIGVVGRDGDVSVMSA